MAKPKAPRRKHATCEDCAKEGKGNSANFANEQGLKI